MENQFNATEKNVVLLEWVNQYSDHLFSWALHKTGIRESAEDLVQETFLAAFKSVDQFNGKSEVKTWLFGILNNKIRDYFRNKYRESLNPEENFADKVFDSDGQWRTNQIPGEWDSDSLLLDNSEFRAVLQDCLDRLPGKWNMAVCLKFMDEKKSELICQELGITPTNLWQIIHRAKLQLRKCLEINWFKN